MKPANEAEPKLGVGGGTVLYAAHFPRFHPSDFRVRSCDGVADDWPIDYATLAPYYDENDRITGVSGLAGDPAYPPSKNPPNYSSMEGYVAARVFAEGLKRGGRAVTRDALVTALEGLQRQLLAAFGDEIRLDRWKQVTGRMTKQIMEERGYSFVRSGMKVKVKELFTTAALYRSE